VLINPNSKRTNHSNTGRAREDRQITTGATAMPVEEGRGSKQDHLAIASVLVPMSSSGK
jgi:hypothetical protein